MRAPEHSPRGHRGEPGGLALRGSWGILKVGKLLLVNANYPLRHVLATIVADCSARRFPGRIRGLPITAFLVTVRH